VTVARAEGKHAVSRDFARRCAREALRSVRCRKGLLSVVLVGSRCLRRLNREFLGHDRVTDVIAFSLGGPETLEGEVYVNVERARSQAREYRVTVREETARLIVHGTLHLAGFDDRRASDALRMRKAEDRVLDSLFVRRKRKK
jgi:probable rRNA maturation factor